MVFCLFIGVLLVTFVYSLLRSLWSKSINAIACWLVILVIVALPTFLIGGAAIREHADVTKTGEQYRAIASLWNETTYSGRFSLGSGYIDGQSRYYFMYDLGEGRFKQGWVRANLTTLEESDKVSPRFVWDTYVIRNRWIAPFDIDPMWDEGNYRLVVPKGTIVKEFSDR